MQELNRSSYLNYDDYATAYLDANGGELPPSLVLGREFDNTVTLMSDLPLVQATHKDKDVGTFEEPWEKDKNSHLMDFGGYYQVSKAGSYAREDRMSMRGSAIAIDTLERREMGDEAFDRLRVNQVARRGKSIALDCEADLVYGNPNKDPRSCLGFQGRFNMITDSDGIIKTAGDAQGMISPYICLDAGGTGSTLTSLYLVIPGEMGVCRIYPKEMGRVTGGIVYTPGVEQDVQGKDPITGVTGWKTQAIDKFDINYGLSFRNRRAAIRIANIDVAQLLADSNASMKKLEGLMYEALDSLDRSIISGAVYCYGNKKLRTVLRQYYNNKVVPADYGNAKPKNVIGDFMWMEGVVVRPLDHILNNETQVK